MGVRRILCAVQSRAGWQVQICQRGLLGWKLEPIRELPGSTSDELLDGLAGFHLQDSLLAVGLDRSQVVVRHVDHGEDSTTALPPGLDLMVWERPAKSDGRSVRELIGFPREHARRIYDSAHSRGAAGVALFPVWVAAIHGSGRMRRDVALRWASGRVVKHRDGFGPWEDMPQVQAVHEGSDTLASALRGGLLLAAAGMPRGWAAGVGARRARDSVLLVVLLLALIGWFGARWSWVARRTASLEQLQAQLVVSASQPIPKACTVGDLVSALARTRGYTGGATLNRLQLSPQGVLTITGKGASAEAILALKDSLKMGEADAVISQGTPPLAFTVKGALPCAH